MSNTETPLPAAIEAAKAALRNSKVEATALGATYESDAIDAAEKVAAALGRDLPESIFIERGDYRSWQITPDGIYWNEPRYDGRGVLIASARVGAGETAHADVSSNDYGPETAKQLREQFLGEVDTILEDFLGQLRATTEQYRTETAGRRRGLAAPARVERALGS